jgi:hypothetical protein
MKYGISRPSAALEKVRLSTWLADGIAGAVAGALLGTGESAGGDVVLSTADSDGGEGAPGGDADVKDAATFLIAAINGGVLAAVVGCSALAEAAGLDVLMDALSLPRAAKVADALPQAARITDTAGAVAARKARRVKWRLRSLLTHPSSNRC